MVCLGLLLLLVSAASECRREGDTWSDEVRGEHSTRGSFRCSLGPPSLQLFFGLSATPIIAGCGLSPSANRQLQHVRVEAEFSFSGHSLCR
jgi:hypothetical protein